MTDAKKKRWSYSVGERGRNRVRTFEHHKTGGLFLEFYEPTRPGARPKVRRVALGHSDEERAKAAAEKLAAELRSAAPVPTAHVRLGELFDMYVSEVTPRKAESTQAHDRMCVETFLRAFGRDREARSLSRREWDRYIKDRRSGALRPAGVKKRRAVRARPIAHDLRFLLAVLNWATMVSDGKGGTLLERNPLKGLPVPKEESPKRPALDAEQYEKLLKVAASVSPLLALALILAHETGHRSSSIRQLRWSDVDLARREVRWRGEADKIGMEHVTPLSAEAVAALERARADRPAIGEAWIFPGEEGECVSRDRLNLWWRHAAKLAGLPAGERRGWHSLRRQFATELKAIPLKDLCALGGWKDPQTVLTCYQQPDEATMRAALESRRPVKVAGGR